MFRLEFRRRELKLTQSEVAKRTGVWRQHIAQIESGRLNPRPEEIDALAAALGLKPEHVMDVISTDAHVTV